MFLVCANGKYEVLPLPKKSTMVQEMNKAIGSRCYEGLRYNARFSVLVDEEGLLNNSPQNELAAYVLDALKMRNPAMMQLIMGNVLFTEPEGGKLSTSALSGLTKLCDHIIQSSYDSFDLATLRREKHLSRAEEESLYGKIATTAALGAPSQKKRRAKTTDESDSDK